MRAFRAHDRLAGWIAALAILLASLAPSVSHALGSVQGSGWLEVCTAQGSKWIADGNDGTPSVPAAGHLFEHCPFCSIHAPPLGLPPAATLVALPVEGRHMVPPVFLAAPRTLHAWVSAQPRAPPHRS